MQPDARLSTNPDVVAREIGAEHVLLHLGTGTYFGLNEVGGRVWQLLEQGEKSLASLNETIAAEFAAPADVIAADLAALAASLLESDLITVV